MFSKNPTSSNVYRLALFSIFFLLTACSGRPYHATPLEALTEFPGALPKGIDLNAVEILQQQPVAGGLSLLYRWQTPDSRQTQTYCVAVTFLTPEGNGWRAQSTGAFADHAGQGSHTACTYSRNHDFTVGYYPGGNILSLTTAFGLSNQGVKIEIEWSDGKTTLVPIQNGTFLHARQEILKVQRIRLLDASGHMLNSQDL